MDGDEDRSDEADETADDQASRRPSPVSLPMEGRHALASRSARRPARPARPEAGDRDRYEAAQPVVAGAGLGADAEAANPSLLHHRSIISFKGEHS
jgi:hypothetical protein